MDKELDRRFTYHSPTPLQTESYLEIRSMARKFASLIVERVPGGREQALALTKLEEVVMWANAGIARNPPSAAE